MKFDKITIKGHDIDVVSMNTIIVGTGAAGFNAADSLYDLGQSDIALLTEGLNMGTSRNTGSDKQTYYKLTLSGNTPDSVYDMAKTLFDGGSMHGDIALVEAALSAKGFYKLASYGVPFPHNKYGEYIGYKTDHDPRERATSAGPLTSKFMTEKLEVQINNKGIKIFDGFVVIAILTKDDKAIGLLAIDTSKQNNENYGFTLFNCTNVIFATGGPAGIYKTSVYPESHIGSSGIAYEAGAAGINVTESQYGLASIKFRWNLSGTYQQVMPRYISTDLDGNDEKEFLDEYFDDKGKLLDCIFLKGYQWPFDPRKIANYGSSIVDILVYNEIQVKGRRVYMDFMKNPTCSLKNNKFDFAMLGSESYKYLENSKALFGLPIERLAHMNQPAIDLYSNNGIDLTSEYLEIAVCAQHNNGGLKGNIWYESNISNLFPVGEVNGTFGVYRPGGSALNSTQVGSFRAAQYIHANYQQEPLGLDSFTKAINDLVSENFDFAKAVSKDNGNSNIISHRNELQVRMTKAGAHIRNLDTVTKAINDCESDLMTLKEDLSISGPFELVEAFRNKDLIVTQFVYLNAIKEFISKGGRSRGSYLVSDNKGVKPLDKLNDDFTFTLDSGDLLKKTCDVTFSFKDKKPKCMFNWEDVKQIPTEDNWFENVWSAYRKNEIIK
ncbi:MAG: FAD-binding protein [Clostridiales bacterium]|nr:FAD-binding protein [Clostridiales bacterium]